MPVRREGIGEDALDNWRRQCSECVPSRAGGMRAAA